MSERTERPPQALRELQQWLASVILEPDVLDDETFRSEIERVIAVDPCERAIERLHAYTGGLPARVYDSLAQDYPALAHVIGASAFHDLVHRYVPLLPAGVYNLNEIGSCLPAFLASDAVAVEFAFAPDLARLELAVRIAFHARERAALDAARLARWTLEDWGEATLRFQPSVAVVSSPWPIRDIWAARNTVIEEIDIALEGRPQHVLVHRLGYEVVCEVVEEQEALALEQLLAGRALGEVAEALVGRGGDPETVSSWFGRWHARGLVVECEREPRFRELR